MPLSSIILRLARNPGSDHPEADPHNGYALVAPLNAEGYLDEAVFARQAAQCHVRRFTPEAEPRLGRLVRHGGQWAIHYGNTADVPDEAVYRLHDHRFILGAYVSIMDDDGELLTYRVTNVAEARDAAA